MKYTTIQVILKAFALLTMGLISVAFFLLKYPTNQIFVSQGEIDSTKYGYNLYESSGEVFTFGFPLNDFYYHGFSKSHLLNVVSESANGGLMEDFLVVLKDVFLNQKSMKLVFKGKNSDGNGEVDYGVKYFGNRIEIDRKISLSKNFDAIGESIVICPGCLVTDNKHRVYLNQGFLTQNMFDFTAKMNLTPLIVGKDQFLPVGISGIIILDKNGKVRMQIPTYPNEQASMQEGWSLLEIRIPVQSARSVTIKQIIYL
jgi:hypothetical protein